MSAEVHKLPVTKVRFSTLLFNAFCWLSGGPLQEEIPKFARTVTCFCLYKMSNALTCFDSPLGKVLGVGRCVSKQNFFWGGRNTGY